MGAYYRSRVDRFLEDETVRIVGALAQGELADHFFCHFNTQSDAWANEIELLQKSFQEVVQALPEAGDWTLLLEYPIPRRGKRIDAVVLAHDLVLVLEFKTGEQTYSKASLRQVEDYALELRDFHANSRDRIIIPVLVATGAFNHESQLPFVVSDGATQPLMCNTVGLAGTLVDVYRAYHDGKGPALDAAEWDNSEYRPVPTIIEAAELLYDGHDVRDIMQAHADSKNLTRTTEVLLQAAADAEEQQRKVICFVTGVPGAGKTLAGLNVIHNKALRRGSKPSGSFLSGNGPLVRIVSEALVRDHARRNRVSRSLARHRVAKIENVHLFLKEHYDDKPDRPSYNRVVVFDEAQRAWSREQEFKKFKRDASEPSIMLRIMDRHDWALIIALVGGGQEINTGESGLAEWGRALSTEFLHWRIIASPEAIQGGHSVAGDTLFDGQVLQELDVTLSPDMHLPVSIRSYKARAVNDWVNAVVDGNAETARKVLANIGQFPIALTRSLAVARKWLQNKARGYRRPGLVASSGAMRLRSQGIELSSGFTRGYKWEEWFLAPPGDVRSSFQLEVAATEFQCQGLELDWVGLCWGCDMTWDPDSNAWRLRQFRGSRWQNTGKHENRVYLVNTYRVLLTRAREGLVVWVPKVGSDDPTVDPAMLDATARYLRDCGIRSLDNP